MCCASSLGAWNQPAGSFHQYSQAFHQPTCIGNIPLSRWRSRHSWTLTTPFIPLSIGHSCLVHSACILDAPSAVLVNSGFNLLESWRAAWESSMPPAQFLVAPAVCLPSDSDLPWSLCVALNRLRTWVSCFGTYLYRWGMLDTPKCTCGAEEQSANHIIFYCNILCPPNCLEDLWSPNINNTKWLVDFVGTATHMQEEIF